MYRICKSWTFDAAHRLPEHDGKCRNPHGHTYKVEAVFEAERVQTSGPKQGMVIDFGDVSSFWKAELEPLLDHKDLNVTLAEHVDPTTAENLAAWIFEMFEVLTDLPIVAVRVWETPSAWAEYAR